MPFRDTELDRPGLQDVATQQMPADVAPVVPARKMYQPASYNQPAASEFVPTPVAQIYPAGMQQTAAPLRETEQTITQTITDPTVKLAYEKSRREQVEAAQAQLDVEKQVSDIKTDAYAKAAIELNQKQQEYNTAVNEFKGKKVVDPYEKWGTMSKIGAAIAMGLGAYAATYSGGKNYAAEIISDAVNRDIALQEQEIRKLGANVDESKNAVAAAYKKFGDIEQAKSAVYMAAMMNAKEDVMNKAKNVDNAQIVARQKAFVGALDEKLADNLAKTRDKTIIQTATRNAVPSASATSGKPLTEAQAKFNLFSKAMVQSEDKIKEHESYAVSLKGTLGKSGIVPEYFKSEQAKSYNQAALAWSEGYLRAASGANVPQPEIEQNIRRAMPASGDSPKILEQKRAYRATLVEGLQEAISGTNVSVSQGQNVPNQVNKLKSQYSFKAQ